jgi:hypothetical protein
MRPPISVVSGNGAGIFVIFYGGNMGIAALVCGIVSVVCSFTGLGALAGVALGIVAIVLGIKARKVPATAGLGTGGLVLGIIGAVLSGILFIVCVGLVGLGAAAAKAAGDSPEVQEAVNELKNLLNN